LTGQDDLAAFLGENGSPKVTARPKWIFNDPEGWNFFIYNDGAALTTGAVASMIETTYGKWIP